MRYKFQALVRWLKQAWVGCFNVRTHVGWMISASVKEKYDEFYFDKAVRSLAADLLKRGVINVRESYDIGFDAFRFRADLKDTFDKREIH